jgi:hypothetical protein
MSQEIVDKPCAYYIQLNLEALIDIIWAVGESLSASSFEEYKKTMNPIEFIHASPTYESLGFQNIPRRLHDPPKPLVLFFELRDLPFT